MLKASHVRRFTVIIINKCFSLRHNFHIRRELHKGDFVRIKMCQFPMATINRLKFTADWFEALRSGFMFNQRPRQTSFDRKLINDDDDDSDGGYGDVI